MAAEQPADGGKTAAGRAKKQAAMSKKGRGMRAERRARSASDVRCEGKGRDCLIAGDDTQYRGKADRFGDEGRQFAILYGRM